jgi:hypothetical protein
MTESLWFGLTLELSKLQCIEPTSRLLSRLESIGSVFGFLGLVFGHHRSLDVQPYC